MKKILPTMIGAVLAGGMSVAAADVTVFGHIDTALVGEDIDTPPPVGSTGPASYDGDDINLVCTTCSIGFKGSEDLGNGLKAIFKLDFQYDTANRHKGDAEKSLTDRDQWLGLAGSGFGKVRAGTISTGYKSHGAAIDPLYRTAAQGRSRGLQSGLHLGAGEELEGRADNTVRWDSPNWNGMKLVAHYTFDSDETDGEDEDPFGIGGSYENGGILVFADYMDNNQGSGPNEEEVSAWKLGGKYSMNNFAVMGQYESVEADDGSVGGDPEFTLWHIAGSYTMGSNMVYLGFGQGSVEVSGSPDEDYDAFTIAGTHSMSKRTMVYAAYSTADCDTGTSDTVCEDVQSSGGDDAVWALGVQHKF